jgi:hypothetical protein
MMFCSLKSVAKVQQPPKKRFPLLEKYLPYFENSLYQYVTKAIFGIKKLQWTAQSCPLEGGSREKYYFNHYSLITYLTTIFRAGRSPILTK